MIITNKEEHRAVVKDLTSKEESLKKVLDLLDTGENFSVDLNKVVVKFYTLDAEGNRTPIADVSRVDGFISDQINKSLNEIDAKILEANATYAGLTPLT